VDFARGKDLLETFSINDRWSQAYKFDFIRHASEAMRIASKVSLRGDSQGVLSLQFMVDVEGGKRSFLDFRFVPFATHDDGDEDDVEIEEYD
jgi:cell cycle checkpoint protein